MIQDKGIYIKNIFYMLTYAYRALRQTNYKDIEAESFEYIEDLFAAILSRGIAQQIKQGLFKEYVDKNDNLNTVKGKIEFNNTIKNEIKRKKVINCEYDELSENVQMNQILKSSALLLLSNKNVKKNNKKQLQNILPAFQNVDEINLKHIQWSRISFQRNNNNYRMLLFVCYFVVNSLLMSTDDGKIKMRMFTENQISHLYEKFILEYYSKHYPELSVKAEQVKWQLSGNENEEALTFLPKMLTDITIRNNKNGKSLIIDAKYYGTIFQESYGKETLRNNHLNQVLTYIVNDDPTGNKRTSGMLLYAKPNGVVDLDLDYTIANRTIYVKDLDLNTDFAHIKKKLDNIISSYL